MIYALSVLMLFLGLFFLISDWFFPAGNVAQLVEVYQFTFQLRVLGFVFFLLGVFVQAVRILPGGMSMFMDLPSSKIVPLIHSRVRGKDPDAKFMKARRVDLEILRAKNKTFKDVGGGFRILGHSCRRTYETIGFTVPDWLSEYFQKIKNKYEPKNSDEWRILREELGKLREDREETKTIKIGEEEKEIKTGVKMSKEQQLRNIKLLEPVMNDPEKRADLLAMDWQQLRRMEELLFDGVVHNGEEVELFIDSATPNEQDILERQTFVNELERHQRYRDPGEINFDKWVPIIIILILVATVCAILLQGAFGGG